jgi:hypothetical protein
MLGRIVERERTIEVCSTFCKLSSVQHGHAHDAMPDHERACCALFLCQFQELGCAVATDIAVEGY